MEGPKRLNFTTVGPPGPEPKKVQVPKTFRFDLDLSETTDTTCPEYFYTELVKTISGDNNENNTSVNPGNPLGDDDDHAKMAALAKSFEDKYNKPDGKKKKKKKWEDNYYLACLGDGYDESDTFIDNSEAYDEVVPETMTTKLGGFYINSGRLDLKEFSDDSDDDFISRTAVKKNKKRRISSDEGSGDEQQTVKKKKVKDTLTVDGEVKKKKKLIVPPGEKPFKKPKVAKDKNKNGKQTTISSLIKSTSPNMNGEKPVENGVHNNGEMTEEMKSNVSMAIDSVIAMASRDDSNSRDIEEPKKEIDPESVPKLPPNLPEGMEARIEELKDQAKQSREGKCKFFTGNVNKLLLEVELLSKQISVGHRSAIFGHLAAFLPCSKETLLKRAKMLRAKELEDKIKEPLEKLKQAVNRVMPAIKEKYEEECKRAALEKQEEGTKEAESKKEEGEEPGKEEAGSEDDDEKTGQSDATKKRQMGPRKKFPWDNDTRNALCDVVRVKMHTYLMARTKAQSAEEFCKAFFEQEVRPLWPKGWMQTRVLYRESKAAHHSYTNPQKPKKTIVLNKVGASSPLNTSGASTPGANASMTERGGSAKTGNVVVMSKVNPSPASIVKVSSTPTNGRSTPVSAKPAGSLNIGRPSMQLPNTPTLPATKAVHTLLNYAQNSSSSSFMSSVLGNKGNPLDTSMDVLRYENSKPSTMSADSQSNSHKTWDHKASDILRSSMTREQANKITPPKPSAQRQNSTTISPAQNTNSFLAHFANFANAPITLLQSGNYSAESAMNLSTKSEQQLLQKHLEIERQKQMLKLGEQHQKTAEKQRQIQQQKQQQQHQEAAKHIITVSRAALSQNAASSQSKPPSQSPMSLAMSKNIPSSQGTLKMTPKQLASQFAGQSLAKYSEAYIRQQLSDKGNLQTQTKKAGMSPAYSQGHVQSPSESLRKTSPQSASQEAHAGSIKSQGSHFQSQDHGLPASISIATNGAPATSLLQSLFGQSQGQTYQTTQQQRSPSQPSLSPQGQKHSVPTTGSLSSNGQWYGQQQVGGARQATINYQGMQLTSEQIAAIQAQQILAQTATMFKTSDGPK